MRTDIWHVMVEYIFDNKQEEDVRFSSVILLRQVSKYFRQNLTDKRLYEKAEAQGGPSLLIMYTLLQRSHSDSITCLLKQSYQRRPSPLCMILLIFNAVHDHPGLNPQIHEQQLQHQRLIQYLPLPKTPLPGPATPYPSLYAFLCKYTPSTDAQTSSHRGILQYLDGQLDRCSMMEHTMDFMMFHYPRNFPILQVFVTFLLALKQGREGSNKNLSDRYLAQLFIRSINRSIAFDRPAEHFLIELLSAMWEMRRPFWNCGSK